MGLYGENEEVCGVCLEPIRHLSLVAHLCHPDDDQGGRNEHVMCWACFDTWNSECDTRFKTDVASEISSAYNINFTSKALTTEDVQTLATTGCYHKATAMIGEMSMHVDVAAARKRLTGVDQNVQFTIADTIDWRQRNRDTTVPIPNTNVSIHGISAGQFVPVLHIDALARRNRTCALCREELRYENEPLLTILVLFSSRIHDSF